MAKKKPALPSLIALNPITSWSDIRQAFRDLLTHESLGDTAVWFESYIEQDIHDGALCDCWDSLSSEMKSYAKYSPNEPCVFTIRDLDCDIEEVVDALVTYNNNPWNFAPGGAPEKLRFDEVMERVKAVLYPQPPAKTGRKRKAA
jgi:hypothetical protein